ncbi:MAG TPA: amidohydrolase family protein [Candidatus Binatia bacterium]|nr:amidohydrolase family protein [Candidatus Binatia bacterium]
MSRAIDADGHVAEPSVVWEKYTEPAFRDRVIQIRPNPGAPDDLWIDGVNLTSGTLNVAATCIPGGLADAEISRRARWQDVPRAASDPRARLEVMDQEGIDVAVLYPTLWLLYGDIHDPLVAAAACRAYDDWIADFCRTDPRRLFAVAPMPIQSVEEAVREMRRVVKDLGFKAVFVRPNPFNDRRLSDPAYDPFWREAQELGIPVAVHSSFGTRMPTLGGDRYRKNPFFFHMVCHTFELMAAAMDVVCGGVLAKFPRLRVGFLESGVGWLGYWLDRMDGHFEKMGPYVPWLKKKPSEYFLEQCFLSLDPDERTVAAMVDLGAERTILWGSDYPHFDCTFPGLVREVEHACAGLSEQAKKSIREENAARFYGF